MLDGAQIFGFKGLLPTETDQKRDPSYMPFFWGDMGSNLWLFWIQKTSSNLLQAASTAAMKLGLGPPAGAAGNGTWKAIDDGCIDMSACVQAVPNLILYV